MNSGNEIFYKNLSEGVILSIEFVRMNVTYGPTSTTSETNTLLLSHTSSDSTYISKVGMAIVMFAYMNLSMYS